MGVVECVVVVVGGGGVGVGVDVGGVVVGGAVGVDVVVPVVVAVVVGVDGAVGVVGHIAAVSKQLSSVRGRAVCRCVLVPRVLCGARWR